MAEKRKIEKLTTPASEVKYAWLDKPNTKFKEDGEYSVDLVLTKEQATEIGKRLKAIAEAAWKEAIEKAEKKNVPKLKSMVQALPIKAETDENGDETGRYILKAATNAVDKDGKSRTVPIYDSQLKRLEGANIGRGSVVKASCNIGPYQMPATGKYGVKLYLNGVQVIKLVPFSGGGDPSADFGVEEGYVASDAPAGGDGTPPADDASPF